VIIGTAQEKWRKGKGKGKEEERLKIKIMTTRLS
jgi:hypothetical protein